MLLSLDGRDGLLLVVRRDKEAVGVCVVVTFTAEVSSDVLLAIRVDDMIELIYHVAREWLSVASGVLGARS